MTVAQLEKELNETEERIQKLDSLINRSLTFKKDRVVELVGLRDHAQRTTERLEEQRRLEAERQAAAERKRLTAEYKTLCEAVAERQDGVEKTVEKVIEGADELRDLRRTLETTATRLEKAGGKIPERPPLALWQRNSNGRVPYAEKTKYALRNL